MLLSYKTASIGMYTMLGLALFSTALELYAVYVDFLIMIIFWACEALAALFLAYMACSLRESIQRNSP